ncbi:MAG: hypothetical protein U0800_15350 [Isosphaeraceae bacterium]
MILSDREIQAAIDSGLIHIEPKPDARLLTSTAIDLTLDATLLGWKAKVAGGEPRSVHPAKAGFDIGMMMQEAELAERIPIPESGYALEPWSFVLGYTAQKICLRRESRIAARIEGKSSLARLGVGVHVTAPTIHGGFGHTAVDRGDVGLPIQLEIFNLGPFRVHLAAGMPICQLILEEIRETPMQGYRGRFSEQQTFRG